MANRVCRHPPPPCLSLILATITTIMIDRWKNKVAIDDAIRLTPGNSGNLSKEKKDEKLAARRNAAVRN